MSLRHSNKMVALYAASNNDYNNLGKLLNVETIIVYRYEDIFSFGELLRAHRKISPRAWLGLDEPPRLQYRWQP